MYGKCSGFSLQRDALVNHCGNMDGGNRDHGNLDHWNLDHWNPDHGNLGHWNPDENFSSSTSLITRCDHCAARMVVVFLESP